MANQTRRAFLGQAALAVAGVGLQSRAALGQDRPSPPNQAQSAAMAEIAQQFMGTYDVPGMSISIAVHGQMVYEQAFGFADRATKEPASPSQLYRIASVSKPITSVAIFTLVEKGSLKTSDYVFGPRGILQNDFGSTAKQPYLDDLKIEHLLTHTGGGWQNDGTDPMFRYPKMNHHELISWTIANLPLTYPPGTHYAYSNFGYCALGRVIEKVTRQEYAAYVKDNVLSRCGVASMRISGNTLAERAPREVVYFGQNESPYDMNVRRMDSHGGWLATPSDLVRFTTHVDGYTTTPNILRPETIAEMITPTEANKGYAHGWAVNSAGNWWHSGSLPGTTTIMVRTKSGLCWAALTNTRKPDSRIGEDLDRMMWKVALSVPDWRA
jgi:CubicO group peptidase (beta-lactamase class C family)